MTEEQSKLVTEGRVAAKKMMRILNRMERSAKSYRLIEQITPLYSCRKKRSISVWRMTF